jgi:hypothetical protein
VLVAKLNGLEAQGIDLEGSDLEINSQVNGIASRPEGEKSIAFNNLRAKYFYSVFLQIDLFK